MVNDTVTVILKKKDAGIIAKALTEYQEKRNIKILDVNFGTNKLRIAFEEILKKQQQQ
jgi:hypothetical protein